MADCKVAYWNLPGPQLYEHVLRREEGRVAHLGPLVVRTGDHTGRSPNDKFLVRESSSQKNVWWGDVNRPFAPEKFDALYARVCAHLKGKEVFVQDCFGGADPAYRLPIRVITEYAWHSLFARNLFIRPDWSKSAEHVPEFTVISVPGFHAQPERDGTQSFTFILVHFGKKLVLIGGTAYGARSRNRSSRF